MIIDVPSRSHVSELRGLWREAFGDSEKFLDIFEQSAFSAERCRCVIENGRVVGALYWFDCSCGEAKIAYLYAIATAKACRGRGICSALIEDTHRHLRDLGYDGAILVPGSKELFDFYKRFGYRVTSRIGEIRCRASDSDVPMRHINVEEYAYLRRKYLPKGGVVQENENLSFLKEQAELYAGESFLLAARREENTLYGVELLGDTEAAADIVNTLGSREGRFRIADGNRPFAMYRELREETCVTPAYFGIAFD